MNPLLKLVCCVLCLVASVNAKAVAGSTEPAEGAPVFFLSEIYPECGCKEKGFRVQPIVEVRDFSYVFQVESPLGDVEVVGKENLEPALREIEVIGHLREIGQTEAFAKTLGQRIADPVMTTFGVARRPVSTVAGLPGGITRYIGGKLYQVRKGSSKAIDKLTTTEEEKEEKARAAEAEANSEEPEEGRGSKIMSSTGDLSRRHLGYNSAKRKWARKFGVDPYSDNALLQEELGRIAWASSFGEFAGDFVIPGSEVVSYAGKAQQLVWDKPAHLLERDNEKQLKKRGVSKELIREFMEADNLSLTDKTSICVSLEQFAKVEGNLLLVDMAMEAETRQDVSVLLRTIALLSRYDQEVCPLESMEIRQGVLTATGVNGYLVLPVAADFLHWTPLVSKMFLSTELESDQREIWVGGSVSEIAKTRLRKNGWEIFENRARR